MDPARPSLSHDTRRLLAIALIAALALWVLARVRFPDRVPSPNPVRPILAQLTPASAFDDIATTLSRLAPRLQESIVALSVEPRAGLAGARSGPVLVAALRIRNDLAVVARDDTTRLDVIRVPSSAAPAIETWAPERPQMPRFLIATDLVGATATFRPVFVGALAATTSLSWPGTIWLAPAHADLAPGSFLFTIDGALAGLVVEQQGRLAIVPGDTVLTAADRLVREPPPPPGWLGVEVQTLTPALARATGATSGVVVTWVDPRGPAASPLAPGDVVGQVDHHAVATPQQWRARLAAVSAGATVAIGLWRGGEARDVDVTAAAGPEPDGERPLGLGLRVVRGVGAAVDRVDPESAGSHAGLQAGDVITLAGGVRAPTPADVARAFARATADRPSLVGVSRGDTHRVAALEKR